VSRASERARADILSAATALFSVAGYAGTSLAEIARRAGCSKAAVLYHFHTKDEILAELVAPGLQTMAALVERIDAAPTEQAQQIAIHGFAELAVRHRDQIVVLHDDLPQLFNSPLFVEAQVLVGRLRTALTRDDTEAAEVATWMGMAGAAAACAQSPDLSDDDLHAALLAGLTRLLA
jgi:AcrR family transcriptional regulator